MQLDHVASCYHCMTISACGAAGQAGTDDSGVSSQLSDVELAAIATLEREVCLPNWQGTLVMVANWRYMVSKQQGASASSRFSLQWC